LISFQTQTTSYLRIFLFANATFFLIYFPNEFEIFLSSTIMTLSTPLKIIIACFAVAALVATTMSGGSVNSTGLKGSRKLQQGNPNVAINSIFGNSESIVTFLNPDAVPVRRFPQLFPPPPPPIGTIAANTIPVNAAVIIKPGDGSAAAFAVKGNSATIIKFGDSSAAARTVNGNSAAIIGQGFTINPFP
jgi:hypothetical protein